MAVENNSTGPRRHGSSPLFPIRYLMAMLGSIGLAIIYGFKVNVSVAIVAMVNHTAIRNLAIHDEFIHENGSLTTTEVCQDDEISNITVSSAEDGPFVWNEPLQGLILSAYFWGYMVSLLPGGRMSELLSAKWVMNGSVLLNGVTFPAMHVMIAKWAPPNERSVLASIVYAGTALGTVISILLSGILAANLGWVWIFYIEGALCLIWCTAWWLIIQDSPEEQTKFITEEEKNYIMESLGHTKNIAGHKEKLKVPWGQILRSTPFWAILIAHFCSNFGWYMLLIELPTYMSQILKFNMSSNAGLSAMPFLCMWIFTMTLSKVLAIMQDKNLITVTFSRKIGTLFSSFVPMICLIGVSYVGCNRALAVVLMTIGVTCIGGMYCGFLSNHIDIAPNFAGTLVAVTNCIATIPGFIVPIFVGKLTHGNQTIEAWRIIFFVTVALYIIEILVYSTFGSGEEQPWNKVNSSLEEINDQTLPLRKNVKK
ncbi:hypothetical protein M0804_012551 [Polistes exclamans]|nr:hypothetical protein M0804_012551 [Polistes exclamans]